MEGGGGGGSHPMSDQVGLVSGWGGGAFVLESRRMPC